MTGASLPTELVVLSASAVVGLLLPGMAFLAVVRASPDPPVRWIYALALGLAVNPLVFLAFHLAAWPVHRASLLVVTALAVTLLAVRTVLALRRRRWLPSIPTPHSLVLLSLFIGTFLLRWIPAAMLPVLPGVDSNQHNVITALFVEREGIPSDYLPFFPLTSFSYHFGFHANAAVLANLTGVPPHRAVTFLAALLVAFSAVGTVVLARALTRNDRLSLVAGALVGFVSVFPAWYLNWARLPQLLGVGLLTVTMGELFSTNRGDRFGRWKLLPVLFAGVFLSHYRMTIALAYAVGVWLVVTGLRRPRALLREAAEIGLLAAAGIVLVLPWLSRLLDSPQLQATSTAAGGQLLPPYYFSYRRISYITSAGTTIWSLLLVAAGALLGAWQRRGELLFLVAWAGILLLFSNPYFLFVPWSGLIDFVTVITMLFPAAAIAASYALDPSGLSPRDQPRWRRGPVVRTVLAVIVVGAGAVQTADILRPRALTPGEADLRAFDWIASSTPEGSRVFSRLYISREGLVQGVNAGVWVSYFTGREQIAPPLIYRGERAASPGYERALKGMVHAQRIIGTPSAYQRLTGLGVTHLYVTEPGESPYARGIEQGRWYRLVFEEPPVRIYEVVPAPAPAP